MAIDHQNEDTHTFCGYGMGRLRLALVAGASAVLATAVVQLVELTFVDSALVNAAVEGLFVGTVVYLGVKSLERSTDSQ